MTLQTALWLGCAGRAQTTAQGDGERQREGDPRSDRRAAANPGCFVAFQGSPALSAAGKEPDQEAGDANRQRQVEWVGTNENESGKPTGDAAVRSVVGSRRPRRVVADMQVAASQNNGWLLFEPRSEPSMWRYHVLREHTAVQPASLEPGRAS
jgi:hypothetical protein